MNKLLLLGLMLLLVGVLPVSAEIQEPEKIGIIEGAPDVNGAVISGTLTPTAHGEADKGWIGKGYSNIWWNSCQARWDGLLPTSTGVPDKDHYIHTDIGSGSPTLTAHELEDRESARMSAVWDDTGKRLYAIGFHITSSEFWSLTYVCGTDTYSFDVGVAGSGVAVTGINRETVNMSGGLTVTPNGDVWVSILNNSGLEIQHSDDNGATWQVATTNLSPTDDNGCTDFIWFEDAGTNYALVWAVEDDLNASPAQLAFFIDENGAPQGAGNWTNDSSNLPAYQGSETADNHCSAAKDSNSNVYLVQKTGNAATGEGLILLYDRTSGGTYTRTVVYTKQAATADDKTRPCLAVDGTNNEIYVVTAKQETPTVRISWYAKADIATLTFGSDVEIFHNSTDEFINPHCPGGETPVDSDSNLLLLQENETTRALWYNEVSIGNPAPVHRIIMISSILGWFQINSLTGI